MRHIDTHSHVHFPHFDEDREESLMRMRERSITTIAVGTNYETSVGAIQLSKKHSDQVIGVTVGVHPTEHKEGFDETRYSELIMNEANVLGVGECGLDYYRIPREDVYVAQRELFEKQIAFALAHNLPLMLHVRPSKGNEDAHHDALEILTKIQHTYGEKVRGTAHFFTSSLEVAKKYWGIGFATSFPGVVTFAPELHEVVKEAPKELMLSETDAPYAAPLLHRGRRNEPAFVEEIVKKIAEVRGEELEDVAQQLVNNSQYIFNTV